MGHLFASLYTVGITVTVLWATINPDIEEKENEPADSLKRPAVETVRILFFPLWWWRFFGHRSV